MGNCWFQVRIVCDKVSESGQKKKEKELYLVDALSFTEAEKRIVDEIAPFVSGEFKVTAMKLENIQEIFNTDIEDGKWYKATINLITLDERTHKEKKTPRNILVYESSTDAALKRLHAGMKGTLVDYQVKQVLETSYLDVYFYDLEHQTDENR